MSQSLGIVPTTNIGPRLTSGIKLVATGLLIAAPCELLLPAALLSRDVRSFFSRHWRIVRNGNPESSGRSLTDRVLEATHKCTATNKNIVSRWVISRVVGSLGVAGAALVDTIKELALGLLTGAYAFGTGLGSIALKGKVVNPLKLKNATGRDAFNHLRDAVIHAVIIVTAPVLGLIAPSKLLLPVMVKINFSDATKSSFLHVIANQTRRISTRQLAFIGASLLGLTAIGHSYGALSALKAVALPWAQNAVSFPLTRKIAAAVMGLLTPRGSGVLHQLGLVVDKINQLHPVAKLTGLAALLLGAWGASGSLAHRIENRRYLASLCTEAIIRGPELQMNHPYADALGYSAELARRTISLTALIKNLSPAHYQLNVTSILARLVDNQGFGWDLVPSHLRQDLIPGDSPSYPFPFMLVQYPDNNQRKCVVKNANGEIISGIKNNMVVVGLTRDEALQLTTSLKKSRNNQLLPSNLENGIKEVPSTDHEVDMLEQSYIAQADKIKITDLIKQLLPIQDLNNEPPKDRLAIVFDSYNQKWEFVTNHGKPGKPPFWLCYLKPEHERKPVVTNAHGKVIGCVQGFRLTGTVELTTAEATQLVTHLTRCPNAEVLPSTFQTRIKESGIEIA